MRGQREKRTTIGYVRENATVDVLEQYGGVLLHRSQVSSDLLSYLDKYRSHLAGAGDLLLANYLAKRGINRTQVCVLTLNRYMLDAVGFTVKRVPTDKQTKEARYLRAVSELKDRGDFRLWAPASGAAPAPASS